LEQGLLEKETVAGLFFNRFEDIFQAGILLRKGNVLGPSPGIRLKDGRERFTAVAGMALDRASYSVLFRLVEGPARLSDLAQKVGIDISTLSRQVHHLEASGLVARTVVEEDRRAALLAVTDKGRDLVRRIRAAKRAAITEI